MTTTNEEHEVMDTGTTSVSLTGERKITWGYTRKKNLGVDAFGNPRYESEEVSVYVTDLVPEDTEVMEHVQAVTDQVIDELKVQVWSALGLSFGFSERGRPLLDAEFRATPPTGPVQVGVGREAVQVTAGGPHHTPPPPAPFTGPVEAKALIGSYAELPAFCKKCGNREFFDNRGDVDKALGEGKKARPDWVCKSCKAGVFRPGSYDYNQTVDGKGPAPVSTQPPAEPF